MAKDFTDILTRAAEVRDESVAQQNTATKVGSVLTDLVDLLRTALSAAELTIKATATELHLLVTNYNDEGAPVQVRIVFPLATETQAGALTAHQLKSLKSFVLSEGAVDASHLPLKYSAPLTGTEQTLVIGNATAERAGVMTAQMFTDLQTATKRSLETIDINQLDTLTTIPLSANGKADYWLTYNNMIVGRLFVFEDMMHHKSTQIIISNCTISDFPSSTHAKEGLTIYYRFYGHNATDVTKDAWTEWKKIFDTDNPTPIATTTSDGHMSKEMVTSMQKLDYVIDMGVVSGSAAAENKAVELAGDKSFMLMRYETTNGQVGTIRQVYSNFGYSMQYLTLNETDYVRVVYYDSGMKSVWRNINKSSIVYKLLYDESSRYLSFHDPIQDNGFGGITLPVGTTTVNGLLKLGTTAGTAYDGAAGQALADRIAELETRLATAENKITAFHS